MGLKTRMKRAAMLLLGVSLCMGCFWGITVKADNAQEIYTCVLFATDETESIRVDSQSLNMNGDIVTNGRLITQVNSSYNGMVYENQDNEMVDLHSDIEDLYFSGDVNRMTGDYVAEDFNENISAATYIDGSFESEGNNVAINGAALWTKGDISIDGGSFSCSAAVIYSEEGDIYIKSDNFSANGLIYAPGGKVYIECNSINLGGSVIARSIEIVSGGVNLNQNESFMKNFSVGIMAEEKEVSEEEEALEETTGETEEEATEETAEEATTETEEATGENVEEVAAETEEATSETEEEAAAETAEESTQETAQGTAEESVTESGMQGEAAGQSDGTSEAVQQASNENVKLVIEVTSQPDIRNPIDIWILLYEILTGKKNIIIF